MGIKPEQLNEIIARAGYRVHSQLGKGAIHSQISSKGKMPDVEPSAGHEPVCEKKSSLEYTGRCFVRIKVFRRRLTDPLGDCTKYHIDSLRYAGLLKDDSDAEIELVEEPHEKVDSLEEERVEITLTYENVAPIKD